MEVIGNSTDPKHYIRINYWGGWGYKKHAVELAEKMKAKGDIFQFNLFKDAEITGRFEVFLQKGAAESEDDVTLWSKLQSQKFP